MQLEQTSHVQTREFRLVFQPGELEDLPSAYAGAPFQPVGGTLKVFRTEFTPWGLGELRVHGVARKKNGQLGTRATDTRLWGGERDTPALLREALAAKLAELNGS
jgi:hypothetical protein